MAPYRHGSLETVLKLMTCQGKSSIYSFFRLTHPQTLVTECYLREERASYLWVDVFPLEQTLPKDAVERTRHAYFPKSYSPED